MINRSLNVLLIEDNPADARWLSEVFKDMNIKSELHIVKDGIEAMQYLYQKDDFKNAPKPDIIILDLSLPRMDGLEVLKSIKRDKNLKSMPVVILTASNYPDDINEAYKNRANYFLIKPVDFNRMSKILDCIELKI